MGAYATKPEEPEMDIEQQVSLATTFPLHDISDEKSTLVPSENVMDKVKVIKSTNAFKNSQPESFYVMYSDKYCNVFYTEGDPESNIMMVNLDNIRPKTPTGAPREN